MPRIYSKLKCNCCYLMEISTSCTKHNKERRFKHLISNTFEADSSLRPKWLILKPIDLTGNYFCEADLLMRLTIIKYTVLLLYGLTCHNVCLLYESKFLIMLHIKCYIG